jgi:hypothetical protein
MEAETLKQASRWNDPDTCEDNVRMGLKRNRMGGVDWTQLAQDRDRWRALVNTAMNFLSP